MDADADAQAWTTVVDALGEADAGERSDALGLTYTRTARKVASGWENGQGRARLGR